MNVVLYARVSTERQATEEKVSIEQQLADCGNLAARRGWHIVGEFVDRERYIKTRSPKRGWRVEPSGEFEDRPAFQKMLAEVKTGRIDAIIAWDDSRLMRHLRVFSEVLTALEEAQPQRQGRADVQIITAGGAVQDRFVLGILVQVAQKENADRARRIKMGRVGTLQAGRWPGVYNRLGYQVIKKEGKRGVTIDIDEPEAETVRYIFDLADTGHSLQEIRRHLLANGHKQKGLEAYKDQQRHAWGIRIIQKILRSPDYMGSATWKFRGGGTYQIAIPQIIDPAQWRRVQAGLDERRRQYPVDTIGVYVLQNLAVCGACGRRLQVAARQYDYYYPKNGPRRCKHLEEPKHSYTCPARWQYPDEATRCKGHWSGPQMDYKVWRHMANEVMNNPNLAEEMAAAQQAELAADVEGAQGKLAEKRARLRELEGERAWCLKQAKTGVITEEEFHRELDETLRKKLDVEAEIDRLEAVKNSGAALEFGTALLKAQLAKFREIIPEINHTPAQLKALTVEDRRKVLERRRGVIQSLVNRVIFEPDGRLVVRVLFNPEQSRRIALPAVDCRL